MEPIKDGYRAEEYYSEYEGTEQRWLVAHLEEAEGRARESVREKIQREREEEVEAFTKLTERVFSCREDAERTLGFLKDTRFMRSSFFLESDRWIMALLMVMTLCLLVYSALEWRIRGGLEARDLGFPDQKGNPTQLPTARWVFKSFLEIHVLFEGERRLVLNMKERNPKILPSWVRNKMNFMPVTHGRRVSKVGSK